MSLTLPHTFGRYTLTRLIGEGGMAEVYLASVRVAEGLSKWVVIKKIRREFADQPEFTRMFVDEAKIALGLNHANIVQVFDFGQIRGDFYLAMEWIEGLDLMRLFHAVRARHEAFPAVIAAYVGHQVASGLAYAHRRTDEFGRPIFIVHMDVSPHNVMLSWDGQVKVLDFGIARTRPILPHEFASTSRDEAEETIKGKVAYMSPEQALGTALDQRSDIYSLGIVLYELLTGELLFRERDRNVALERVRREPVPPILERAPDLPDDLARIVDRALARVVDDRFATARDMQVELARFLHDADPVVDDEVVHTFISSFRSREEPHQDGLRVATAWSHAATREVGDTHAPAAAHSGRTAAKVILLCACFAPSSPENPDRTLDLSRLVELVRDVAFKREAEVLNLTSTGALLAFGTMLSGADDAKRAVRVALSLREAIGESAPWVGLGLILAGAHVGVSRAEDGRSSVDLPPGLADQLTRMASRAVDERILVTSELATRLEHSWRFGPLGLAQPATPEGVMGTPWAADLQQVAPLLGPLSEAERRRNAAVPGRKQLVGRELELKTLRDALADALRSSRSRGALIIGDPGMGKRALINRFTGSLPSGACLVLRTTAQWSDRNRPFAAFLDPLARILQLESDARVEQVERALRDLGVSDADTLAPALATSLGLPEAGRMPMPPPDVLEKTSRVVRRLLRALAVRRPIVLVVEDVHLIDEPSLRIVQDWLHQEHPVPLFTIATARSGPRAEMLSNSSVVTTIQLKELDDLARRDLVLRRFEDPEEAAPLAEAILARTGGNPLFIEEVLASLLHRGVVAWNDQARFLVVRERSLDIAVPPSVEAALATRLDALALDDRDALQAAAILGRSFRPHEVEAMIGRSVTASLERLSGMELLEPDVSTAGCLQFSTLSLHEVCVGSIAAINLELLHGRAAQIKRSRGDYLEGRDDGPIADHLFQTSRPSQALDPALRASRYWYDADGNVSAYEYLTLALKAMPVGDERRFGVLLEREPILRAWGRRRARGADIRSLIAEAERSQDAEREVVASLRLLRFYLECGRIQQSLRLLPRLRARVRALPAPELHLPIMAELESDLNFARGELELAQSVAREALDLCWEDDRGIRQRCRLLRCIGSAQIGLGLLDAATQTFQAGLELARRIGYRRLEADTLNHLGEVAGRGTRYQEAIDCFRAALAIDRDLGDRAGTGRKLANLGLVFNAIGLYRRAERYLRKALDLHAAIGHPALLNDVIVSLGEVAAELGDPESARELLEEAAEVATHRRDIRTELRARSRLALVKLEFPVETDQGVSAAKQLAEDVERRAREAGLRSARVRALQVLARIAEQGGEIEHAITLESTAVQLVDAGAAPVDGVRSVHHLGTLLRLQGRETEATACLQRAADNIRRRMDELRDEDLRSGYAAQPAVQRILADGAS